MQEIAEVLRRQIADVDAPVVQVDEANLPGHPEHAELAAGAINHLLSGVKGERGVHLCFGNYGGQTIQQGQWACLMPFFNRLNCDHLVLEFARRGYSELSLFRDLKPEIRLGIGVIDIKDNEVESPDTIARRIEHAIQVLGADRIRYVHPDCGFWMLSRSVADRKMRALVEGRDLVSQ
jgi:5-methyltetrahydropteroyltriglutamate--homocysteine methyltransferase